MKILKSLFSLTLIAFALLIVGNVHARVAVSKSSVVDYLKSTSTADEQVEHYVNLLNDVYQNYGEAGLRQLQDCETRDEVIATLSGMRLSPVAQAMTDGVPSTRLINRALSTISGSVQIAPDTDGELTDSMIDQVMTGAFDKDDINVNNAAEYCLVHCMKCGSDHCQQTPDSLASGNMATDQMLNATDQMKANTQSTDLIKNMKTNVQKVNIRH